MRRTAPPGAETTPAGGPYGSSRSSVKSREIAPGVIEVFLPLPSKPTIVNVYLLDCGGGEWALVDTGVASAASREAFAAVLRERGIAPEAIRHVLATHHHPDHFGASALLCEATGGRAYLHPAEVERVHYTLSAGAEDMIAHSRRHGIPIPAEPLDAPKPSEVWAATFAPRTEVEHALQDGEVLHLGRRLLLVVWTPGHTPGHCCFLDLDQRVLFVGDHLLPRITPHVGVYATGPRNPLADFLASQEKVAALDEVELVCPAHGPVYADHRRRAAQIIAHHEQRARATANALRDGPATAYLVARQVFPHLYENDQDADRFQRGAAVMETIAHLELLRGRGVVRREDAGDVLEYRLAG